MGEVTTLCETRSRVLLDASGDRNATVTLGDAHVQLLFVGKARAPIVEKLTYPDAEFASSEIGTGWGPWW